MSEILDTLLPFIWFTGIAITGYIFFHKFHTKRINFIEYIYYKYFKKHCKIQR